MQEICTAEYQRLLEGEERGQAHYVEVHISLRLGPNVRDEQSFELAKNRDGGRLHQLISITMVFRAHTRPHLRVMRGLEAEEVCAVRNSP